MNFRSIMAVGIIAAVAFGIALYVVGHSSNSPFVAEAEFHSPKRAEATSPAALHYNSAPPIPLPAVSQAPISSRQVPQKSPAVLQPSTIGEKLDRLLAAVNSRETAQAYLDGLVEQGPVVSLRPENIPKISILREEELTPEQRRAWADVMAKGNRLVFARYGESDVVHELEIAPFPERLIMPQVRAFLTDADIQDFQDKMIYSSIEKAALWQKQEPK